MVRKRFVFKNNNVAYIWPDHPLVIAGNIILDDVIKRIDNNLDCETICEYIVHKYNQKHEEVYEYVNNIINTISVVNDIKPNNLSNPNIEISMATFNITSSCNLKCKHCYASAGRKIEKDELSVKDIEPTIKKLSKIVKHSPKLLILSGGEPTLNIEKLILAIEVAYKYGFNVRVNSNGMIITKELINALKSCKVLTQISIDGSTATSHSLLRNSNKSYNFARETVRTLAKNGCRVRVSMTTHKDNYKEIPLVFEQAIKDGAEQFITSNLVITGEAMKNGLKSIPLKEEFRILYNCVKGNKKLQWMTKSTLLAETINAMRAGVKFVNCGTGICTCCIDSDGSLYPCINMVDEKYKIANILQVDLMNEIWNNSPIINTLQKLTVDNINDKCPKCIFRYFCGAYCRGETISNGGTLYDPYFRCNEWKQALIYVLYILAETPDLYYFNRNSEVEMMERE